jgi:ATP-dependent helicase HrpA
VPDHLRITFRVEDESGAAVAEGKDLTALRRQLAPAARDAVAEATEDLERDGLRAWHPGTVAKVVQRKRAGHQVTAYPALVDEADSVAVRVFATEAEQARAMWSGTRRLLMLEVPTPVPVLSKRLSNAVKLGLTRYPYASVPDLLEDCVAAAVDSIVTDHGGPSFDDDGYALLREAVRAELPDTTAAVVVRVEKAVAAAHEARTALAGPFPPALEPSIEDMRAQLFGLIRPGFVTATGPSRLGDLPGTCGASAGGWRNSPPTRPATGPGWPRSRRSRPSTTTCVRPYPRTAATRRTWWRCAGSSRSCGSACSRRICARRCRSPRCDCSGPWTHCDNNPLSIV